MPSLESVMIKDVICVHADTPLAEVIHLLLEHNITGVPVVDDENHLVGIISEKDTLNSICVVNAMISGAGFSGMFASDVMSREVVSFDIDDTLSDIIKCLNTQDFRRVPILSDGKVVGIISRKDLLRLEMIRTAAATSSDISQ
jgi:CBS domain-containing protein